MTIRPEPTLTYEFSLHVDLAEGWLDTSSGGSGGYVTPIIGGTSEGRLTGRVLPVGADWSRRVGSTSRLDARYLIESDEYGIVHVRTTGYYRVLGEGADVTLAYFRIAAEFDSAHPALAWLTEHQLIGAAEDLGDAIRIHFSSVH